MKRILTVLTVLFLSAASFAQQTDFLSNNPFDGGFDGGFNLGSDTGFGSKGGRETVSVSGKFIQDTNSPSTGKLLLEAVVPDGFHMYSITQKAGGPYAAKITLDSSAQYSISGAFIRMPGSSSWNGTTVRRAISSMPPIRLFTRTGTR